MTTAFFTNERFSLHTLQGHPEHAGRLEAVIRLYKEKVVWEHLFQVTAVPATEEQLLRVHTPRHLEVLKSVNRPAMLEMDTYVVPESYELARLAVGGVLAVVDSVMRGDAANGIAAVRPPGHHATPARAMGFCLLSNIAIAARHARAAHSLERVAVVDFDVHHGNGTQDALYDDPTILFMSSHQSPLYPGTGAVHEIGRGAGKGFTANAPLPPGVGDTGIQELYEKFLWPLLRRFQPQLILVSAGFDAHWRDPLANLMFSLTGFDHITRELIKMAEELCDGKIIFVMEGGYDLEVLSHGWLNVASALLGSSEISDPIGSYRQSHDLPPELLQTLLTIHGLTV
ncbi:MAG: histone deacetylase [Anaerolineae bacterium]|nr:histone deacetylase [Anaerolineae bacterium]